MKIVKAGYEILSLTDKALETIEIAARTCYKSEDKIGDYEKTKKFVQARLNPEKPHEAVIEFADVIVRFICDRGVSHELVRHRLASFCQESTRYCNYAGEVTFIQPCWFEHDFTKWDQDRLNKFVKGGLAELSTDEVPTFVEYSWLRHMMACEELYTSLLEVDQSPQQARAVLPNSTKTEVVMKANFREIRHFLRLRTSRAAHPQMREITEPFMLELRDRVPVVFDDIVKEWEQYA